MTGPAGAVVHSALSSLLHEILEGAEAQQCWVLNPRDQGLLRSLDRLTAEAASAVAPQGGASIAAHVDHLHYGLTLMNRWQRGENPFSDADYGASWNRGQVTEDQWRDLRDRLRVEARLWLDAVQRPRPLSPFELTGVVASIVHLAYHLGAIRQIDRSIRGPAAAD
jgi:hypothetical protein